MTPYKLVVVSRTSLGRRVTGLPAIEDAMILLLLRYLVSYAVATDGLAIRRATSFPPNSGPYGAIAPHTVTSIISTPTWVALAFRAIR
jgi:hypothetical protein